MSLIIDYLNLHDKYKKEYGDKACVFMQVGSFYEMYSTLTKGPCLEDISQLLNLIVTRRDKSITTIDEKNPKMMGFPMISLNKNLKLMTEDGWTVIMIDQVTSPPNPKRELTNIYSPSTYIEEMNNYDTNYLISLYISYEKQRDGKMLPCIGFTAIDLNIGQIKVIEYLSTNLDSNLSFDKVKESIIKLGYREIIIHSQNDFQDKIKEELNFKNIKFLNEVDKNILKISYQEKFFEKIFEGKNNLINIFEDLGIEKNEYLRISLINALNYCYIQNENLLKKISKPKFITEDKLFLGNNTLTGLNVINCEKSLFDIINFTSTVLGKRLLKERLINPEINEKEITYRYQMIHDLIKDDKYLEIDKYLKNIKDIERYSRRIVISSLHPFELYNLCYSLQNFQEIIKSDDKYQELYLSLKDFEDYITERFEVSLLEKFTLKDILQNFFKKGKFPELDKLDEKVDLGENLVGDLINAFNGITKEDMKFTIKNNKKEGQYLIITKKRGDKLLDFLKNWNEIDIKGKIKIKTKDLEISHTKTNTKIKVPQLGETHIDHNTLQLAISNKSKEIYLSILYEISEKYLKVINESIQIISEKDFFVNGVKVAKKYNYIQPEIEIGENSFVNFENLRHPIIERIINYEYIPQTLEIGKDQKGILLYGLNSSGKSSFQKSIGLGIILAQMGYYVPATSFKYKPYKSIFTRIDGNDNLYKGLSSFSLEMMDLKNILRYSNKDSLIIGDEVCKGTEYLSANSILASTIITLSRMESSFIFATHLHSIPKLEEIKNLGNVECYHLSVGLNNKNELIFERKLQKGQGEEVYGILVASNIIQDNEFITLTNKIKLKLLNKPESILTGKQSRYNSKVYVDECEICGKRNTNENYEVHHIHHQKDCEEGFVKNKELSHISKNSKSNLVVLCEDCHTKIHQDKLKIENKIQKIKNVNIM